MSIVHHHQTSHTCLGGVYCDKGVVSKLFTLSTLGTVFILRLNINTGHGGDDGVIKLWRSWGESALCSLHLLRVCVYCVMFSRVTPRIHTSSC